MSNVTMKSELSDQNAALEASLEVALSELRELLSPDEKAALLVLQRRWADYRSALQEYSRSTFEGGTNASLSAAVAGADATKKRVAELRAEIARRSRK